MSRRLIAFLIVVLYFAVDLEILAGIVEINFVVIKHAVLIGYHAVAAVGSNSNEGSKECYYKIKAECFSNSFHRDVRLMVC